MENRQDYSLVETKYRYDTIVRALKEYAKQSPDESKVGCYIVDNTYRTILGKGVNRFPRNILDDSWRLEDEHKHNYVIHAEMNACIDSAKKRNIVEDAIMIVVGKCICKNCALFIIESGIKKIHCPPPDTNSKWVESNEQALALLVEAEINVVVDPDLRGIEDGLTCLSKYKE